MEFNSFGFALFLPIVFLLYWCVFNKSSKSQNAILLISSIVFYLQADWKFISLLMISGIVNFRLAKILIQKEDESFSRRFIFYTGIIFNVGVLLYFKYFNFFIQSFVSLLNYNEAVDISFTPFHILLPLGISFFTFQMIGYLIDVNNEEIEPTNNLLNFFTYLVYFPKILSGPIEKVQDFLPQIETKRNFKYALAVDGAKQFLWGLFKKVVIANNITSLVDTVFSNSQNMSGSTLCIGAIFYAISLYADFSGYSDMACGVSKLFNIKIMNNFAFPFFSTNISGFWKRWHISLTSWMMHYIYMPLSFITREYKKFGLILSINLTFLLVGLWHGANWTFVIFGLYHGLLFIPLIFKGSILNNNELQVNKFGLPSLKDLFKIIGTFLTVTLGMIIFRSENIDQAFQIFLEIASISLFSIPQIRPTDLSVLIFVFFTIEWIGRREEYAIEKLWLKYPKVLRWGIYYSIAMIIFLYSGKEHEFIYLQF